MQNNDQHRAAHTSVWILKNGERKKKLACKTKLKIPQACPKAAYARATFI